MTLRHRGTIVDTLEHVDDPHPAFELVAACVRSFLRGDLPDHERLRHAATALDLPSALVDALATSVDDEGWAMTAIDAVPRLLTAAVGSPPLRVAAGDEDTGTVLGAAPMLVSTVEVLAWEDRDHADVLFVGCGTPGALDSAPGPQPAVILTCDLDRGASHYPPSDYIYAVSTINAFDAVAYVLAVAIEARRSVAADD